MTDANRRPKHFGREIAFVFLARIYRTRPMRSYDAEPMSIGKKQTFLARTWEGKAFQTGTRSGSPLIGDRFERTER